MKRFFIALPIFALLGALSIPNDRLPGKLRKAFEALEVYNYFAAREGFYRYLEKHPVPSAYGLSVIYGRDDNPFFSLDSAFKYVTLSASTLPALDAKALADSEEVGVDSTAIHRQVVRIDSLIFLRAVHEGTVDALQGYMDRHTTERFREMARSERNALAFEAAEDAHTSAAYAEFMERYPDASQIGQARAAYHKTLYEEFTRSGRVSDYQRFLEKYPESPYAEAAEYEVFKQMTQPRTAASYKSFIEDNPANRFVDEAWRSLYALEIADQSPKSIAAFSLKYPDYPFFDELQSDFNLASTRFYPFTADGLWGFLDDTGTERIPAMYEWTESFSEELALVGVGDSAMYIDKRNRPLTQKYFDEGLPFKQGFAVVDVDGYQGVINRLGMWVIPPEYDVCGEYVEGFFFAEKEGDYGYLNRFGEVVVPFEYDRASDFANGRAVVERDGQMAYVDTLGRLVTPFGFEWLEPMGPDSVARMRAGEDGLFGLIGYDGDTIVPPVFEALGDLHEGLMLAANGNSYGFINTRGDTVIDFLYHFTPEALTTSFFEGGRAIVYQKVKRDVKLGLVDRANTKILPAMFNGIGNYQDTLIAVRKKDLWGYADLEVNLVIPYLYDEAGPFKDSLAVVASKSKYGLLHTSGHMAIPAKFRALQRKDSLVLAQDTLWGLLTVRGDTLIPFAYSEAEILDTHMLKLTTPEGMIAYYHMRQKVFVWREQES